MRAYTVGIASFALDVPAKWLDNVLTHHRVPGVDVGKQGIQRRIPAETLVILALARSLHRTIGSPLARALELAERAASDPEGRMPLGSGDAAYAGDLQLSADVASVRRKLETRLREAVEFGAAPRRGRPPKRHQ